MAHTKDSILAFLKDLNINYAVYDHAPVATCELHTNALKELGVDCTGQAKNLFLKAPSGAGKMKNRVFLVSALVDTIVDSKELSKRMGIKASAPLRFGNDELFDKLLQIPKGSVTPLCMANESANEIVLILDEQLKKHKQCIFHPMTNESSVIFSPEDLDTFAQKACPGRVQWVDFAASSPLEVPELGAQAVCEKPQDSAPAKKKEDTKKKDEDAEEKPEKKEQHFAEDHYFTPTAWEDGPFTKAHVKWLLKSH
eukprot:GEMP01070991.1.p1 GENE.GEMP01070991.1~~GEMP01070991.1.p1  ORF type:complete len:254 (+),score=67.33 GEMP01070991.1:128-889(+)